MEYFRKYPGAMTSSGAHLSAEDYYQDVAKEGRYCGAGGARPLLLTNTIRPE